MTLDYHFSDMLPQSKLQVATDAASTAIAAGAMTTHFWLPALKEASEIAAAFLPFLGIVLIMLQIAVYVRRLWRGRHHQ